MKNVRIIFLKGYNAIIVALLTILGFSSVCTSCVKEYGSPPVEYGSPYATFIVKGSIESIVNNKPVPNIKVIMNKDTVYSDNNGNYQVSVVDHSWILTDTIQYRDIDGTTNGAFKPLDTIVVFKNPVFTNGDGHWYKGQTETEFNVKLKPQK